MEEFEDKLDMIKSQLKHFEIFQENYTVYIKIPSTIDIEQLGDNKPDVLFHTIDEIDNDDSFSDSQTVLECDIENINSKDLLCLLIELNELQRKTYEI